MMDRPLLTRGKSRGKLPNFEDVFGGGVFELPLPLLLLHPPASSDIGAPTNFDVRLVLPEHHRAVVGIHAATLSKGPDIGQSGQLDAVTAVPL